jgi:hypothetical protein
MDFLFIGKFLPRGEEETVQEPSGLGIGQLGRASATLLTSLMEPSCKAHTQILKEEKLHIQKKKPSYTGKSS